MEAPGPVWISKALVQKIDWTYGSPSPFYSQIPRDA